MRKTQGTEAVLEELAQIRRAPFSAEDAERLHSALSGGSGIVAARAAQIIERADDVSFTPTLISTFDRFIDQPKRDRSCWGKEAICRALDRLSCMDPEPFRRGIRHVQMEPVFGGRADTAAGLRGICAAALARMMVPDVHFDLAALLMDPEPAARLGAVNAVSSLGCERSELLLRMRALANDPEPEITGRCFAGLLAMEPDRSLPFVAGHLSSSDPQTAAQAAAALGQTGDKRAYEALRRHWDNNTDFGFADSLLLSIGLTRLDEAFDFLLETLREGGRAHSLAALEALRLYSTDPGRRDAIRAAVEANADPRVTESYQQSYDR